MSFSCSHAGPSDLGGGAPTQGAAGPAGFSAGAIIYQGKKGYKMVRQYLMGDLLGEGAQGKVKEAVDSESLRRVAIKIINLRQLRKVRNAEENLRHELSIHRRLKQANVVELIEEFRVAEKEKLYVVLELVNGGSLQQLADSMPDHILPERLTARFTRMLFHGLAYCHSKGIVHRDIKPSNLMVSTDGVLKISDFGVSEELDKYSGADTCSKSRGSPAFQPPEVASGSLQFSGFKVDVWASGVSLFLLTTGQVPFSGTSLINLFENISRGEYRVPEKIRANAPLVELLQGLLECDETARWSVGDALKHRWLEDRGEEEEERWGEKQRSWVAQIREHAQPSSMLAAITKMYGDSFQDSAATATVATVATVATATVATPAAPELPTNAVVACPVTQPLAPPPVASARSAATALGGGAAAAGDRRVHGAASSPSTHRRSQSWDVGTARPGAGLGAATADLDKKDCRLS